MKQQPCDFKAMRGRPEIVICRRPGCILPPVQVPLRRSTGKPWPASKVHRYCSVKLPMGLGDYVAKAIETLLPWTRKKKCELCNQRQEKLNELGRRITG